MASGRHVGGKEGFTVSKRSNLERMGRRADAWQIERIQAEPLTGLVMNLSGAAGEIIHLKIVKRCSGFVEQRDLSEGIDERMHGDLSVPFKE